MSARLTYESASPQSFATIGRRVLLGSLLTAMISCHHSAPQGESASPSPSDSPPPVDKTPVVVLIAIDGVRYQDVFDGPTRRDQDVALSREQLVPQLIEMERRGVSLGAPETPGFYASGPNYVSLPGYMEMLSGTSATGCTENDCEVMSIPTLIDDFQGRAPDDPTRAGAFSSWPNIQVAATAARNGVVSAGRFAGFHHSALRRHAQCKKHLDHGKSDAGGFGHFRHDAITAQLSFSFLTEARPDFTFVSLGETDEAAHAGNYPAYLRALEQADRFIGAVREHLAQIEAAGRPTLLVVTSDHGRAQNFNDHGRAYPESSRSFLFAEGKQIRALGRFSMEKSYLRDIAPTLRAAGSLPIREIPGGGRVLKEILSDPTQ